MRKAVGHILTSSSWKYWGAWRYNAASPENRRNHHFYVGNVVLARGTTWKMPSPWGGVIIIILMVRCTQPSTSSSLCIARMDVRGMVTLGPRHPLPSLQLLQASLLSQLQENVYNSNYEISSFFFLLRKTTFSFQIRWRQKLLSKISWNTASKKWTFMVGKWNQFWLLAPR